MPFSCNKNLSCYWSAFYAGHLIIKDFDLINQSEELRALFVCETFYGQFVFVHFCWRPQFNTSNIHGDVGKPINFLITLPFAGVN